MASQLQRVLSALLEQCHVNRATDRARVLCDPEDGGVTDLTDLLNSSDEMLGCYLPKGKVGTVRCLVSTALDAQQPGVKPPAPILTTPRQSGAAFSLGQAPSTAHPSNEGNRGCLPPAHPGLHPRKANPSPKAAAPLTSQTPSPIISGGISPPARPKAAPVQAPATAASPASIHWSPPAPPEQGLRPGPHLPPRPDSLQQPPPPRDHSRGNAVTARWRARMPPESAGSRDTGSDPRRRSRSLGPELLAPADRSPRPARTYPKAVSFGGSPRECVSVGPSVPPPSKHLSPPAGALPVSRSPAYCDAQSLREWGSPAAANGASLQRYLSPAARPAVPEPAPFPDPPVGSPLPQRRWSSGARAPSQGSRWRASSAPAQRPPAASAAGPHYSLTGLGSGRSAHGDQTAAVSHPTAAGDYATAPSTAVGTYYPAAVPPAQYRPPAPAAERASPLLDGPIEPELCNFIGPADLSPSTGLPPDAAGQACRLRQPTPRRTPSRKLSFDDSLEEPTAPAQSPVDAHLQQPVTYRTSHYNIVSYPLDADGKRMYDGAFRATVAASGAVTTHSREPSPTGRLSPFAQELAEQERADTPPAPDPRPPASAFPLPQRPTEATDPEPRRAACTPWVAHAAALAPLRTPDHGRVPPVFGAADGPGTDYPGTRRQAPEGAPYVYKTSSDISPPQTTAALSAARTAFGPHSPHAPAAGLGGTPDPQLSASKAVTAALPRSRSAPQLHGATAPRPKSPLGQGYVYLEVSPLNTRMELNLPNGSNVRMYPVPLGTVEAAPGAVAPAPAAPGAVAPAPAAPAHALPSPPLPRAPHRNSPPMPPPSDGPGSSIQNSSLRYSCLPPSQHPNAARASAFKSPGRMPAPLPFTPTAVPGLLPTSPPLTVPLGIVASGPQMASYLRPMSPPHLQATDVSQYPPVPPVLLPGVRPLVSPEPVPPVSPRAIGTNTSPMWPPPAAPIPFSPLSERQASPVTGGKSPKRTDPASLCATIADYNLQYAKWKASVPRPPQGPTLPLEWVFQVGDVLEVTLAQTPSLSCREPLARDLYVTDPALLRLKQATLAHYPDAKSWVLKAAAPGQTEVVYAETYGGAEKAERRFIAWIL